MFNFVDSIQIASPHYFGSLLTEKLNLKMTKMLQSRFIDCNRIQMLDLLFLNQAINYRTGAIKIFMKYFSISTTIPY